jgi:WD40 repeat protein
MSASDDHLAYFFDVNTETKETKVHYTITHKKEIFSLALHPLNQLVFAASKDKTWSFHDLENQTCLMINEDFANSDFNLRLIFFSFFF